MVTTPLRADAARNKEKILVAARELFAEQGMDAPLDGLAKRAGVGAGTLYRHFPGREALVAELLMAEMGDLEQEFVALRQADLHVLERLDRWAQVLQRWMTRYSGLPEPLRQALGKDSNALTYGCDMVIGWTDELVRDGKAAGVVNDFVTGREFYRATLGLAWVAAAAGATRGAESENLYHLARAGWHSTVQ
jgi:AcrR family transcriptional regulator